MSRPAQAALVVLVPALLIALAYGGSINNGFVWDDETLILRNASVQDLSTWPAYFSDRSTISNDEVLSRMYRPLQTLSFAMDWKVWNGRPAGFHLTALLLHLFVCIAMVFAFRPVTGVRAAVLAALLFAIHPAVSESVLGLASRGNQLYTLFGLLTIGCMVRIRSVPDRMQAGAILAFAAALLAKEPAIVLVILAPMILFLRPDRDASGVPSRGTAWMPLVAVAAIYVGLRFMVAGSAVTMPYWGGSLWATLQMQARAFAVYIRLIVWPFDLKARYVIPEPGPFPDSGVLLSVVLCAALLLPAMYLVRREGRLRLAAGAVIWFFVSLAPVANLIPVPGSMMAERFLYFTMAGALPLLVGALLPRNMKMKVPVAVALVLVGAAYVLVDRSRTRVWKNNQVFFETLAARLPDDPVAQTRQAQEELDRGEVGAALARLENLSARSIDSPFPKGRATFHYWYGRALLASDRPLEAVPRFEAAASHFPVRELLLYHAEALARSGRLDEAGAKLQHHLRDHPDDDAAWNGLGNVRWMSGDLQGARESYGQAVSINPDNIEARTNLNRIGG